MTHFAPLFFLLCLFACAASAAEFRVPLMKQPPKIDGVFAAAEWSASAEFDRFVETKEGKAEKRRAVGYVGATETHLCVAIRTQLPDEGALTSAVTADSMKAVYDDSLEVYVCPTPDAPDRVDYQFLSNALGKGGYNIHKTGNIEADVAWRGEWTHAHGTNDGWWTFECAIPIASMPTGKGRKATDGVWAINLTRNWKPDWGWSSISGGYANSGLRFVFTQEPVPVVHVEAKGDPFTLPLEQTLSVRNPGAAPLELAASLHLVRNNMPELREDKTFKLAPGADEKLAFKIDANDPTTQFEMRVRVASADGKTVFYERPLKWARAKTPYRWIVGKPKDAPPVDFLFAYYPTKNLLRLRADITNLPAEAKPTGALVLVRTEKEKKEIARLALPIAAFKDGLCEKELELPPLEGQYEIAIKAEGEKVPAQETVKPFERLKFEWENSTAGKSETVYPPFTPIRFEGKTLKTVLREHALSGVGLWDQVTATSANTGIAKPVLAAPMRYAVKIGGAQAEVRAEAMKTVAAKENEAVTEGAFAAGDLKASWKNTWDYDGTVRVDLTLQPTGGKTVDELTLEIPFAPEQATLLHANSDRIRAPIAQKVPEGNGVVWDSTKLACDDHIRNFCPYIYVGSAVRGICFFAENDRNWGWDPKTPSADLVRKDGQVILRVHLVNQPTALAEARTLTFGLLAAPVKPRMSKAGESPDWWRHRYFRDNYTMLGTDINWLALGDCGSVYPAGQDMELWKAIARGNKERLSDAEIEAVAERGKKYYEPYGEERIQNYVNHARANLRGRYGATMVFYYNRASCQLFPEFETFKDEWCLDDWRSIGKGNGIGEIKIVPTASYIDYNLHWYGKSFEFGGNRGVYWDNWFISPTLNTGMTEAYRRADGSVAPASGIWALRELAKRTFVYMNERKMLPVTFPHMTSFSCLPMLSFATVQYEWEWKYSEGDVQDRYTREYLQLASSGDLAGVWSVPLHDHGKLVDDQRTQRTFAAVRLAHELDGFGGWARMDVPGQAANRKLADLVMPILDRPGLQTFKYWEDRPLPVKPAGADLAVLVYAVPGQEAIAIVTSYEAKDAQTELVIDAKALGFGACRVEDVETGQAVPVKDGKASLAIERHGLKLLRIKP